MGNRVKNLTEASTPSFVFVLFFFKWPHLSLCIFPSAVVSDAEWAEWRVLHRALGVPPPHSTLPVLYHSAVAFPAHPMLLLPGPSHFQPTFAPLPCSGLPSNKFTYCPEKAGEHHWGRVSGLYGELKTELFDLQACKKNN